VFAYGNGTVFHYLSLEVGGESNGYSLGTTVEYAYRVVNLREICNIRSAYLVVLIF